MIFDKSAGYLDPSEAPKPFVDPKAEKKKYAAEAVERLFILFNRPPVFNDEDFAVEVQAVLADLIFLEENINLEIYDYKTCAEYKKSLSELLEKVAKPESFSPEEKIKIARDFSVLAGDICSLFQSRMNR